MAELDALRSVARARELCEKVEQERRVASLVLILRHLADHGYLDSYERLAKESGVSLIKLDTADNIDLSRIVIEFEESYLSKYGRKPKLYRRVTDQGGPLQRGPLQSIAISSRRSSQSSTTSSQPASSSSTPPETPATPNPPSSTLAGLPPVSGAMAARQRREKAAAVVAAATTTAAAATAAGSGQDVARKTKAASPTKAVAREGGPDQGNVQPGLDFSVHGQSVNTAAVLPGPANDTAIDAFAGRLLKPLPLHLGGEYGELAASISRDIYVESTDVCWDQIAGLDEAKRLLKEAVVMPIKYPDLFTGLLTPWKGLLLYGPPGTGKTLLAKAVTTECSTTFFNISASSIISKWRGDSEKLVRVLFDLARHHAPSTIFLDEIDALMGARGGSSEHEASRRMKTELLIQLDGLARSDALVFVLAATNLPWELDVALLRRLEKRIMVPLPSQAARAAMFQKLLQGRVTPDVEWQQLAAATEGYSGSDVRLAAKEAAMRPLRRLMERLEPELTTPSSSSSNSSGAAGPKAGTAVNRQQPQSPAGPAASPISSSSRQAGAPGSRSSQAPSSGEVGNQSSSSSSTGGSSSSCAAVAGLQGGSKEGGQQPLLGPVTAADVAAALAATKPSAQSHSQEYQEFTRLYGQVV